MNVQQQTELADVLIPTLPPSPYPGLRPFEKAEWPIFFGRERMIDAVGSRLLERRIVIVHGASGGGKSSLVRAGLQAHLEQQVARSGFRWRTCVMRPGNKPLANLADALANEIASNSDHNSQTISIQRALNQGRRAPVALMESLRLCPTDRLCIVMDQFEELFRFSREVSTDESNLLTDFLVSFAETPPDRMYLIVTMRSDFIGECARYEGLPETINNTQYLLPRMMTDDLLRAVCEPATLYGGKVTEQLAKRLVADARGGEDELPLIQHGLSRLWYFATSGSSSDATPVLDLPAYESRGSLEQLLSDHADAITNAAESGLPERSLVQELFRALTDINADGNAIRRPQTFQDLVAVTGAKSERLLAILDQFRQPSVSFVTPYQPAKIEADTAVDISHEALIRRWRRIADPRQGWLQQEFRDGLVWRSLAVQAQAFLANERACLDPATTEQRWPWFEKIRERPAWALRYLIERKGSREPQEEPEWQAVERLMAESYERWQHEKNRTRAAELKAETARAEFIDLALDGTAERTRAAELKVEIAPIEFIDPALDGRADPKDAPAIDKLRASARDAIRKLNRVCEDDDVVDAKKLVEALRNVAAYDEMGQLAEAISRRDPRDAKNRRLYAQYLINTGKATAAIDLLTPLKERLPQDDPEFAEAMGLIGRAYKQIFFDADDKSQPSAQEALSQSVAAYRVPFEIAPNTNIWHGVNLLAVLTRARRLGLRVAPELSPTQIAKTVVAALEATPEQKRDKHWYLATLAEASLGLDDWDAVERHVRAYTESKDVKPFQLESTLRQFTEIWDVESIDERGRGLVATLRARLLQLSGGEIKVAPTELQRWREQADPPKDQLEEILGSQGPQTYQWWKTGLERVRSVASIRQKLGSRIGTGFLVRAASLGLQPPDELLVVTCFHIVNENGISPGIRAADAEVVFEATDPDKGYSVAAVRWSSPVRRHDVSVLRLQEAVIGINPMPLASTLPIVQHGARVYIVGHPGGRDLSFSFQDNELLDHEGPPGGNPQIKGVSRVHYRAATEPGSGGSPVFNAGQWEVIAVHHMGLKAGMPRLNGKGGSYGANEGISIPSIKEAIISGT
jgi:hypothetical protein